MSKSITNNARSERKVSMIHLFEFKLGYNAVLGYQSILRFTDHDIFVTFDSEEWTPLSITFDRLSEDFTQQSDSITVNIDNINGALTEQALNYEWRNNPAKITRVAFTPPSETINSETYDYGYGDNLDVYPKIDLDSISAKDSWDLFEGVIDTFSASESSLQGTLTTEFATWNKPYPYRTFNQSEFSSVVEAITDTIYWGSQKNI